MLLVLQRYLFDTRFQFVIQSILFRNKSKSRGTRGLHETRIISLHQHPHYLLYNAAAISFSLRSHSFVCSSAEFASLDPSAVTISFCLYPVIVLLKYAPLPSANFGEVVISTRRRPASSSLSATPVMFATKVKTLIKRPFSKFLNRPWKSKLMSSQCCHGTASGGTASEAAC